MKTKATWLIGKVGDFIRDLRKWLFVLIALMIALFVIKCISVALTDVFSFDGGMNVQVAQNLEKKLAYATNYEGKFFDQRLQTGFPVILPVAILFKIFGESFAAGLMVNAIYLILLAFAIIYYLKKCLKVNNFFVLLAIILLYGTPELFTLGFGLYGEIPMLFYLMLMLIQLNKYEDVSRPKFLFLAGLFLGVGYLTKTVILICVPALIFAVIFDFIFKKHATLGVWSKVNSFFKEYWMFPAGFLVPVLLFEIYKMISLGITTYLSWWQEQWFAILAQAGVRPGGQGFEDTNGIFTKLTNHLWLLSTYTGISRPIIIFLLVIILLTFFGILAYSIFLFRAKQKLTESVKMFFSNEILVLIAVSLSYFGWWLLITPTQKAWYRRIIVGHILVEICLVVLVFFLWKSGHKLISGGRKTSSYLLRMLTLGLTILLTLGSGISYFQTKNYTISFENTAEKKAILTAGQYIRNLPENAEIFTYGWWQAPVVSFASGRIFDNISRILFTDITPGLLTEKYFIVDSYAYDLSKGRWQTALFPFDHTIVYSQEYDLDKSRWQSEFYPYISTLNFSQEPKKVTIWKLNARGYYSYVKFSDLEKRQVSYSSIDFTKNNLSIFVRNVFLNEDSVQGKWVSPVSGYLFKYNGESFLKINLSIIDLSKYRQNIVEMQVYANNFLVARYQINQGGPKELIVPLENIVGDTLEITIKCNAAFAVQGDGRALTFFLKEMELDK
jgi:hypothetical protein